MNNKTLIQLRHRFIEDTGAPIQLLESPYFEERLDLFEKDFQTRSNYDKYLKSIGDAEDENTVNKFLDSYYNLRQSMIDDLKNSEMFKAFNADKNIETCYETGLKNNKTNFHPIGNVNLYTQEQDGEIFLSIDMKKANFQAFRKFNQGFFNGASTWEEFVGQYTDMEWAKTSKRTRQIIFGQLNPKRTMQWEKFIMFSVGCWIEERTNLSKWFDLFSMNSDELIYKLKDKSAAPYIYSGQMFDVLTEKNIFEGKIGPQVGLDLNIQCFQLLSHIFETQGGDRKYVYIKSDIKDGSRQYKCVDSMYFPQIYKMINGIELTENDLVFKYDKSETAKLMNYLKMVK